MVMQKAVREGKGEMRVVQEGKRCVEGEGWQRDRWHGG
jgi:hypothetical protein